MNEPLRWREANAAAPQGARKLLLHAHGPVPMTAGAKARSAARVAAIAATPIAASIALQWLSGKSLTLFAAFGLLGSAIGLTTFAMRTHIGESAPIAAQMTHVGKAIATPTAPVEPHLPLPNNEGVRAAGNAPSSGRVSGGMAVPTPPQERGGPVASPGAANDTMAAEQTMLEAVRKSMATSPASAFAKLEEHKATYPAGKLASEREFLAVKALKSLGRDAEAKKRGEAFLAAYPTSLYADLVRKQIDGL